MARFAVGIETSLRAVYRSLLDSECWRWYAWSVGTGRKPLTRELYDSLVAIFRESPGNVRLAARRAPCSRQLAKRLWDGAPYRDYPWAKAISTVLEEERMAAAARARDLAARAATEAEAVREKARQEAIESLAQEKQMLKAARGDVLGALVLAAELIPAMRQVAKAVAKACEPGPDGSPPAIPPGLAMGLLTRHATLVQKAVGATEAIVQLSRLDRGAATIHVGVVAEDLTLDQAADELEALEETLRAARSKAPRLGSGGTIDAEGDEVDELV